MTTPQEKTARAARTAAYTAAYLAHAAYVAARDAYAANHTTTTLAAAHAARDAYVDAAYTAFDAARGE